MRLRSNAGANAHANGKPENSLFERFLVFSKVPVWAVSVLFLIGTAWRWAFTQEVSDMLDCGSCLLKQSVVHELQFLLVMLALHQLAGWLHRRWLGAAIRLLVLACLLVMLIDVAVFRLFVVRFNWHELLKFSGELGAAKAFVAQLLNDRAQGWVAVALAAGGVALGFLYVTRPGIPNRIRRSAYAWTVPIALALSLQPLQAISFHTPYVETAARAFVRPQTRLVPYQQAPEMNHPVAAPSQCMPGLATRPNLMLLVVESMSSFHSQALGGIHDWTPQLDQWLAKGLNVRGFHANGISTEDGLVALLTGLPPVPRPQEGNLFDQYASVPGSLPTYLRGLGYHTAFLTTGNLSFMGKSKWLGGIGFEEIEGHRHPFYDGMPRFHFDAATDQALYARTLQWMGEQRDAPYFVTLETVSTHQPYKNPVTGEKSLESVVRYADAELGKFLSKLSARGFFDNGYLILTSDHRSMVPVSSAETRAFGDKAYTSVPMLVLGPGLNPQQTAGQFSQTDVLPTIQHLTSTAPFCTAPGQGVFWPGAVREPDCVLTRRAYDLDLVVIQCAEQHHAVRLDAHQTEFVTEPPGPLHWIDQVHSLRLGEGWLSGQPSAP